MVERKGGREIYMSLDQARDYLIKRNDQFLRGERPIFSLRLAAEVYKAIHYRDLSISLDGGQKAVSPARIPPLKEIAAKYTNPHQQT